MSEIVTYAFEACLNLSCGIRNFLFLLFLAPASNSRTAHSNCHQSISLSSVAPLSSLHGMELWHASAWAFIIGMSGATRSVGFQANSGIIAGAGLITI